MGSYTVILRRTPDHEDLVTVTDSEVLSRMVARWVGQGGKASSANSADADILEYILAKLGARIVAKSRTFLVKVKTHRGEPLNERADDLTEADREMEKEGENSRWQERTTRVVYSYYDRHLVQWKKGTWTKTIRHAVRRGEVESLMEERLQIGANKWRKGLFEERSKDTDGDQQMQDQNDWLRDNTITWKTRRRLLQTNTGVFPCESRLKKWGKHPDGICELCKRYREMGLKLLGGRPARDTTGRGRCAGTGNLSRRGPRSHWGNLCRNTSHHSHSTHGRVWSRPRTTMRSGR
jgi:hypothetical protein